MNAKFTPGPWRVGDAGHGVFEPVGITYIASYVKKAANARLISAAPDMYLAVNDILAALRRLRDEKPREWDLLTSQSPDLWTAWDKLKSALEKAEGLE